MLFKFLIYPINWSWYGENKSDYVNWIELNNIDYKLKFNKCINSLKNNIKNTNLCYSIIDYIKDNFNKKLLFTHSLHPTNILLYEIFKSIFLNFNEYDYDYDLNNQLIDCWFNPFTSKMITDLNILFNVEVNDEFYINRYNTNKNNNQHFCDE